MWAPVAQHSHWENIFVALDPRGLGHEEGGAKAPLVCFPPETCKCAMLQIFVEIERARLTRRLATIKEAEGNIAEAADTLQEVPVVSLWCWRAVAL